MLSKAWNLCLRIWSHMEQKHKQSTTKSVDSAFAIKKLIVIQIHKNKNSIISLMQGTQNRQIHRDRKEDSDYQSPREKDTTIINERFQSSSLGYSGVEGDGSCLTV